MDCSVTHVRGAGANAKKDSLKLRASVARLKKICRSFKLEVLHAQLMAGAFNKMASVLFRLSPSSKLLGSTFYADAAWDKVVFLSGEATIVIREELWLQAGTV
jgi:hypothetical protein